MGKMDNNTVRITQIVGEPHLKHFYDIETVHQIDKGGRNSVKSSKNEVKCALQMLKDPTCEVAVIRQNYTDHRDTTFAGLKIGFERLKVPLVGGRDYPMGKNSAMYIQTPYGNYVHFGGMNDTDSIKGMRPTKLGNEIKIVWLFEITQFKSQYDMEQAIATFIRGNKDYFFILYEYNPHPKRSHWTYDWARRMSKRDDCYVQHTNYNDLPKWQQDEWLGKLAIKNIQMLKEMDVEQYKSIYLGLPANLAGGIYKGFTRTRHVGVCGLQQYMKVDIGIDYAVTDATVFTARGTLPGYAGIEFPMTFYHKNGVSAGQYLMEDYIREFFKFAFKVYERFGLAMTIWVDSANKDFKETLEREIMRRGIYYIAVGRLNKLKKVDRVKPRKGEIKKKDDSALQGRINIFNRMLGAGFVTIDPECIELIAAIEEAEYDKNGNPLDDGSVDRDSVDSMDYSYLDDIDLIDEVIFERGGNLDGNRQDETQETPKYHI